MKSDPTVADIERAHIQFYIDQVDDTDGHQGKGQGRGKEENVKTSFVFKFTK